MGHGLPDWYRGVDIAYQALSQMIVRPKYGGTKLGYISGALPANAATVILNISGTGMHYGAYFWITAAVMPDNDYFAFNIDGETLSLPTFKQYKDYNLTQAFGTEPFGTVYDPVNKIVAGGTGAGKTWESNYTLSYVETHGQNPVATLFYYYALLASS